MVMQGILFLNIISIDLGSRGAHGGFVTWHSICSSPIDLRVAACGAIPYFFLPSTTYSLVPVMGTMRYFCPADCEVYSLRNCLQLAQLCPPKRHSQENCCKTKTQQSINKRIWVNDWASDNTGLLPARQRLVSCDLCCHGGARHV